jgi:DNA-binding transcriptional regulator YdaS (Cro superfamily)
MSPNHDFVRFVDGVGGRRQAAEILNCKYAAIDHAYSGRRKISAGMAIAVERASNGKFRATDLRDDSQAITAKVA